MIVERNPSLALAPAGLSPAALDRRFLEEPSRLSQVRRFLCGSGRGDPGQQERKEVEERRESALTVSWKQSWGICVGEAGGESAWNFSALTGFPLTLRPDPEFWVPDVRCCPAVALQTESGMCSS